MQAMRRLTPICVALVLLGGAVGCGSSTSSTSTATKTHTATKATAASCPSGQEAFYTPATHERTCLTSGTAATTSEKNQCPYGQEFDNIGPHPKDRCVPRPRFKCDSGEETRVNDEGREECVPRHQEQVAEPTATTGESLPSRDARGFIEGPTEYTDHGIRIRLNAEQAAKPMEEDEKEHLFHIDVRDLAYAQAAGEPTAEETKNSGGFGVTFGASGFRFTTKPPLLTCVSQNIEGVAAALGQTCTVHGESFTIAEVFDETTKVQILQSNVAPQKLYGEMVALLPGIYSG
jgi:hypothetical protein